ncbi:MAG TPA: hypothetical protein VFA60_07450 [Terriglobales bacterium]|nr:hypothetical protein [Terriglobales bacterium]
MSGTRFVQAQIKIERPQEFEQLRGAVERVFASRAGQFLGELRSRGLRVREWEKLLAARVLEALDPALASGQSAQALYAALTVSDQAQMREFYLTRLEQVEPKLREKFARLFETY